MSKEWINDVADILQAKSGSYYMKIKKDIDLKEGQRLVLKKKVDEIDSSIKAGKISEEYGEELKKKLHFVKYSIHVPPADEN